MSKWAKAQSSGWRGCTMTQDHPIAQRRCSFFFTTYGYIWNRARENVSKAERIKLRHEDKD